MLTIISLLYMSVSFSFYTHTCFVPIYTIFEIQSYITLTSVFMSRFAATMFKVLVTVSLKFGIFHNSDSYYLFLVSVLHGAIAQGNFLYQHFVKPY